jgi:hypothetical protein
MSEWKPIETAPKDGRKVVVMTPGYHVRSARYIESLAGWSAWEGSDNDDHLKPTHWMPMPELPRS